MRMSQALHMADEHEPAAAAAAATAATRRRRQTHQNSSKKNNNSSSSTDDIQMTTASRPRRDVAGFGESLHRHDTAIMNGGRGSGPTFGAAKTRRNFRHHQKKNLGFSALFGSKSRASNISGPTRGLYRTLSRYSSYGTLSSTRLQAMAMSEDPNVPTGTRFRGLAERVLDRLNTNKFWTTKPDPDSKLSQSPADRIANVFQESRLKLAALPSISKRAATNAIADITELMLVIDANSANHGRNEFAILSAGVLLLSRFYPDQLSHELATVRSLVGRAIDGQTELLRRTVTQMLDALYKTLPELAKYDVLKDGAKDELVYKVSSYSGTDFGSSSVSGSESTEALNVPVGSSSNQSAPANPDDADDIDWSELPDELHIGIWKRELVLNATGHALSQYSRDQLGMKSQDLRKDVPRLAAVVARLINHALSIELDAPVRDLSHDHLAVLISSDFFDFAPRAVLYGKACDADVLNVGAFLDTAAQTMLHSASASYSEQVAQLHVHTEAEQLVHSLRWVVAVLVAVLLVLLSYSAIWKEHKLTEFVDENMYRFYCGSVFGDHIPGRAILANTNVTELPGIAGCVNVGSCRSLGGSDCDLGVTKFSFPVGTTIALVVLMGFEAFNNMFVFPTRSIIVSVLLASNFFADPRVVLQQPGGSGDAAGLGPGPGRRRAPILALGVPSSQWDIHLWILMGAFVVVGYILLFRQRYNMPWYRNTTTVEWWNRLSGWGRFQFLLISIFVTCSIGYLSSVVVAAVLQLSMFPELYTFETILITSRNPANAVGFTMYFVGALFCAAAYAMLAHIIKQHHSLHDRIHFQLADVETAYFTEQSYVKLRGDAVLTFTMFAAKDSRVWSLPTEEEERLQAVAAAESESESDDRKIQIQ
jgi:hypothetical protein